MSSDVHFASARMKRLAAEDSLPAKFQRLLQQHDLKAMFGDKRVAIKMHVGGHLGYTTIHPLFFRLLVSAVKEAGGTPFLTDGSFSVAGSPARGYTAETIGCPIYPVAGVNDRYFYEKKVAYRSLKKVQVAGEIADADAMIVFSHGKGHGQCGFGGAIKNLAMGGVSSHPRHGSWEKCRGKTHFLVGNLPEWGGAPPCTLCGTCERHCPMGAIAIEGKTVRVGDECWRCGRCVSACPNAALSTTKDEDGFHRALAAQAAAVIRTFVPGKIAYLTFLLEMQPECDCMDMCDVPMVQNVGVLIASDPVAIDAAALDLVAKAPLLPGSRADRLIAAGYDGRDPFGAVHLKDSWRQVRYAAELGIGNPDYSLKSIS